MKHVSPGFFPPIPVADDPSKPMYVQLYDWFRSAIISGGLRPRAKSSFQPVAGFRAESFSDYRVDRIPAVARRRLSGRIG